MILDNIKIGTLNWMNSNLNVDSFHNGDMIQEVKTDEDWKLFAELGKPCWCYYDNDPLNGSIYGKLYNWHAVADKRGLAPEGWHIPSEKEFSILVDNLGGPAIAGGSLKSRSYWNMPNTGATNSSIFTGLPGGFRYEDGQFIFKGNYGYWWTSSEFDSLNALGVRLNYDDVSLNQYDYPKCIGFSIRCVLD